MSLPYLDNPPPVAEPVYWEHAPGMRLAWNEFGTPDGAPVFYYHGWPGSRLQARLAHHLAKDRGLRLIAMDRPGMGKSTLIIGRKLEDWPELMARFADHLGIAEFAQLGVSGGGPYVLACAAMIPGRLTRSAVLAGMVPLPLLGHERRGLHPIYRLLIPFRKAPAPLYTGLFMVASLICQARPDQLPVSLLLHTLAGKDKEIILRHPDVWEVLMKSFTEGVCGPSGGRGVMTDAEIYLRMPGFTTKGVTHPIRYWHGADDKNIPLSLVRRLCEILPHAQLEAVDGLGHFSLAVLRAADALDYLAERA